MLLVGNHSGGNLTPDTTVFVLAFSAYFGAERPFYQLAHSLVLAMPPLWWLRKFGTVVASPENARRALAKGAAVLVYPGGDYEVHRPTWESAKVDFDGRMGFIRAAHRADVPLVPIAFAAHVRATLPSARHLELDCGHVPQLERPAEAHAAIAAFFKEGAQS